MILSNYKLNNYIEVISYKNQFVLFNKLNGCIILYEQDNIVLRDNEFYVLDSSKDNYMFLKENRFFEEDQLIQEEIRKKLNTSLQGNQMILTISVTEQCNLRCAYCYQQNWDRKGAIDEQQNIKNIEAYIIQMLQKFTLTEGILTIWCIGGEPLLKANYIIEIKNHIERIIDDKFSKIKIFYRIDTNAMLLTPEFISKFSNLTITTTLTSKRDHDALRSNSYDVVINKLCSLKEFFLNPRYRLCIRYNVNHQNIDEIENVIEKLNSLELNFLFDVQNIYNSDGANFTNLITDTEFEILYIEKIAPILKKYNQPTNILPAYGLSRHCRADNIFNQKIYSNGYFALCDAISKDRAEAKIKNWLEPLPDICISCFDFPYCGGPKPCVESKCQGIYEKKELMRRKICKYVELYYEDE